MPILGLRLSPDLHERFIAECERRDEKPCDVGRRLIEAYADHSADTPMNRTGLNSQIAHLPKRAAQPGIRGFALDGSTLTPNLGERIKVAKR